MKESQLIRSALFVPGNRPDRIDKAVRTAADVIVIDLEDAVPHASKEQTRPVVREKILEHKNRKVFVRVNGLDSEWIQADLDELMVEALFGIIIPKVEKAEHIREINRLVLKAETKNAIAPGTVSIIPLIESARGIENAFKIVTEKTEPHRLVTVAFGAADFTLDMGIEISKSGEELAYPRAKLAVACRAAGLEPPLDSPYMIDLKDLQALEADAKRAKQLGFQGKLCIHPNQVEICNRIFSPTKAEIEYARKVIQAFSDAEAAGRAAIQVKGQFVDYAVVERSKRILKIAEKIIGTG